MSPIAAISSTTTTTTTRMGVYDCSLKTIYFIFFLLKYSYILLPVADGHVLNEWRVEYA